MYSLANIEIISVGASLFSIVIGIKAFPQVSRADQFPYLALLMQPGHLVWSSPNDTRIETIGGSLIMNACRGKFIYEKSLSLKNKTALEDLTGKRYTYGNIADMLGYAAAFFKERGLGKCTRIAVVAKSGADLGLLFFLVSENCVFIPLDYEFPKIEFEKRYDLLDVDILMVEKDYNGPAIEGWKGNIIKYSVAGGSLLFTTEPSFDHLSGRDESTDETAMVLTTSGTTSTPKVVPLTNENLLVSALKKIDFFKFSEEDTDLIFTPLFKGTSINSMLATILSGGTVLISDGFSHITFIEIMKKAPVTWFTASPAVLNSIADYSKKIGTCFAGSSLRFIRSSGAPLNRGTKEYLEEVFGVPVIQTYGMTETRTITSTYGLSFYKEGSVGVSTGSELKIEDGEILVRGRNVFPGYENNDAANEASFSDGWFKTGDMGSIDGDGHVFITGRAKEMINKGGEKISPYEVEDAILRIDSVKEAAVFPYPNGYGSDDAGAVLVLEDGFDLTLKGLRGQLSGRLSSFKMPSLVYVVNEIPISRYGKVQRKMLFQKLDTLYPHVLSSRNEAGQDELDGKSMTDTERKLARIWMDVLGVKSVGLNDNFFDLGGDSLAAAELFIEIEERFQLQISVDDLFGGNTIRELAKIVESGNKSDFSFLVKIKDGNEGRPLFFVHSGDGEIVTYHDISKSMKKNRPLLGLKFSRDVDWNHPVDFDQLAKRYIHEIKTVQPQGPYRLLGSCHGGVLAYHLACRLNDMGDKVSLLAMIDPLMSSTVAGTGKFGMRKRIWYALVDIKERKVRELPSIIAKKAASFFRVLKFMVQYRLYDYACNNMKKIPGFISTLIILKKAKEITPLEEFEGKIHYLLPSKTAKGSALSIDYWEKLADEVEVVEFEGTHNYMTSINAPSLAMKIEGILEKTDDG